MASYQDLTASNAHKHSLRDQQPDVATKDSALATMQADMDAALKNKQKTNNDKVNDDQAHDDQTSATQSDECIAKNINSDGVQVLDESQLSRVIEMAWEDRTPFGAIEHSYGLNEAGVIKLMRQTLKPSSFRLWRQRVSSRATKHQAKREFDVGRAYCKTQYKPR